MERKTDTESKTRFRSERFFMSQGQWYVNVRESDVPLGPFPSREAAQGGLHDYLIQQGVDPGDDPWGRPGGTN